MHMGVNIKLLFHNVRSKLVSMDKVSENDVTILVIGPPGSGKTDFINKVSQREVLEVDHHLRGGTPKIDSVLCTPKVEKPRVILIDTPPHTGPYSDSALEKWLKEKKRNVHVKGVLYLHKISDNRETTKPHTDMFHLKRCAADFKAAPAILVTTFWRQNPEKPCKDESQCECLPHKRMRELSQSWGAKLDGAKALPYYTRDVDDACDIVLQLLKKMDLSTVPTLKGAENANASEKNE